MALETGTYISDLNASNPAAGDAVAAGYQHLQLIKSTVKATFPNVSGAVTPTHTELNYVDGVTSAIQTQLDAKAPSASPTFTGTVVLPAATSIGTVSSTEIGYLDNVTSPIQTQLDSKSALASPTFTGTPAAPTAANGTNTTQLATTAFVLANPPIGNWRLITTATASASATVDFTSGIGSTYDAYLFEFVNIRPATNGAALWLRVSSNGGSSYDTTGYTGGVHTITGSGSWSSTTSTAEVPVSGSLSNSVAAFSGQLFITRVTTGGGSLAMNSVGNVIDSSSNQSLALGSARNSANANALRILASTGNITSGTINFYGRVK